ncbi:hypothetical protein [Allosphingosinicella sp.]|uniref:hypothetical protein n=1 Tax=Allosphingosinicella sp. TaxID=2823234 RepID=UPI002FC18858
MTIDPLVLLPILVASLIRTPAQQRSYFGSADPLALTIAVNAIVDRVMSDLRQLDKPEGAASE